MVVYASQKARIWNLLFLDWLCTISLGISLSSLTVTSLQSCAKVPRVLLGAGDLNSGPHTNAGDTTLNHPLYPWGIFWMVGLVWVRLLFACLFSRKFFVAQPRLLLAVQLKPAPPAGSKVSERMNL